MTFCTAFVILACIGQCICSLTGRTSPRERLRDQLKAWLSMRVLLQSDIDRLTSRRRCTIEFRVRLLSYCATRARCWEFCDPTFLLDFLIIDARPFASEASFYSRRPTVVVRLPILPLLPAPSVRR